MIYLTGDTHGDLDIRKLSSKNFKDGKNLTKDDYVIELGDFGIIWKNEPDNDELYWKDWLSNKPWTTLIIPGNHENYLRINKLPEVDMFGAKIKKYTDSIYIFNRGEIYNINNKTFFCMGGAYSIDKIHRIENISWWKEEQPTYQEYEYGLQNLEKYNWEVDYILGHTCPKVIGEIYLKSLGIIDDRNLKLDGISKYFDEVIKKTKFKKFYFGHWHDNKVIKYKDREYIMLYEDIVSL